MPTPTGLPKVGEVWEKQVNVLGEVGPKIRFVVTERSRGDYWAMRVAYIVTRDGRNYWERELWVDCAYGLQQGWYKYIGPSGPKTKKQLGLA